MTNSLPKPPKYVKSSVEWRKWHEDKKHHWCADCGVYVGYGGSAHHIIAKGMGGGKRDDRDENLVALCYACHLKRHNGGKLND